MCVDPSRRHASHALSPLPNNITRDESAKGSKGKTSFLILFLLFSHGVYILLYGGIQLTYPTTTRSSRSGEKTCIPFRNSGSLLKTFAGRAAAAASCFASPWTQRRGDYVPGWKNSRWRNENGCVCVCSVYVPLWKFWTWRRKRWSPGVLKEEIKKRKEKKPSGFYCSTKKQQQKKKKKIFV